MSDGKEQKPVLATKKAVALRYSKGQDNAPKVIATGKGVIAESIIRTAKDHGVHVHEDPSLVEVLSKLDLDEQIPSELFQLVAEVLTFVYSVDKKARERIDTFANS